MQTKIKTIEVHIIPYVDFGLIPSPTSVGSLFGKEV